MKIKDIVSLQEMDNMLKVQAISPDGKTVTLTNPQGQTIDTTATSLMPDAHKPGQYTMAPPDPTKIATGATVTQQQPSMEDGAGGPGDQYIQQLNAMKSQYKEPWMQKQLDYRIQAVQQGMIPRSGTGGQIKVLDPVSWEKSQDPKIIARLIGKDGMSPEYLQKTNAFGRALDYVGLEEKHHDTVASGNHDVGGDPTDEFIDQVKDQDFERQNRPSMGRGSVSPVGSGKLKEGDELMQWLTIAGIK